MNYLRIRRFASGTIRRCRSDAPPWQLKNESKFSILIPQDIVAMMSHITDPILMPQLYFSQGGFRARGIWHYPSAFDPMDPTFMPLRALLYRRPTEPQAIEVYVARAIYLVRLRRHRLARRYTLRIHAATREVVLTMPPRGSLREAKAFAEKHGAWIAARLGRLPKAVPFAPNVIIPLARRSASHRASPRHSRHGVDRNQ